MAWISVLATGGTIATRRGPDGSAVARARADELAAGLLLAPGTELRVEDVSRLGSYRRTLERADEPAHRVHAELARGADGWS